MRGPVFIYHGGCFDGFTAAWLFYQVFPNAEFVPARYGDPLPEVTGRDVWVVDFSYPSEQMTELATRAESLSWMDHHKTAAALADSIRPLCRLCEFDMNRCGAMILLDYFANHPGDDFIIDTAGRWLVEYVQDRDLWKLELPHTRAVAAWVAAQPMTFKAWTALCMGGFAQAVRSGEAVQTYINQYGHKAREHARVEEIAGYNVPTVNLPYMNCSEHVGALLDENPGAPFAAGYFRRDDGRWQFSLRSRPDFDVSKIAEQFGGGGHAGAAGFDVESLPWT